MQRKIYYYDAAGTIRKIIDVQPEDAGQDANNDGAADTRLTVINGSKGVSAKGQASARPTDADRAGHSQPLARFAR